MVRAACLLMVLAACLLMEQHACSWYSMPAHGIACLLMVHDAPMSTQTWSSKHFSPYKQKHACSWCSTACMLMVQHSMHAHGAAQHACSWCCTASLLMVQHSMHAHGAAQHACSWCSTACMLMIQNACSWYSMPAHGTEWLLMVQNGCSWYSSRTVIHTSVRCTLLFAKKCSRRPVTAVNKFIFLPCRRCPSMACDVKRSGLYELDNI